MAREGFISKDDRQKVVSDTIWGVSRATFIVIALVAIVAIVGVVGWSLNVGTSEVRGAGDTEIRRNSANNRISAQAFFEDTFENIKATDTKIGVAQTSLDALIAMPPPQGDNVALTQHNQRLSQLQTEVRGLISICLDAIAKYDAEGRKVLRGEWRSEELPQEISKTDPSTDCKANAA